VTKTLAVVYDAGVLLAADKNDRAVWAEQRVRLSAGIIRDRHDGSRRH
jgi:hypothetical protein